jgi:hypothetical protein
MTQHPAAAGEPRDEPQPTVGGAGIEPTWAESAEMNCVSADGRTGFTVRLARYPGTKVAWLWLAVVTPDAVFGYNDNALPLTGLQGMTDVECDDVTYALPGASNARLRRRGPRSGIISVSAAAVVPGHRDPHPPPGPGTEEVAVEATFRPRHVPASARPRRLEALGEARARLRTPDGVVDFAGLGHWHEQYGPRPYFARRFTYATLRGEQLAFIATKTASLATGFAVRGDAVTEVAGFEIDPPATERAFRLTLVDGHVIEGAAQLQHRFSVAIEGGRRPSTVVVARTPYGPLSGLINDWLPDEGTA